jgi:hypothetical protein
MDPWYKTAIPRQEVREGRSFNPDEFAIHLEQVVAGTAPDDYRKPEQFFARTCFTRALREHAGMVLRRLAGQTANTAPVMTLITQFGGGKTHTLASLYHLVRNSDRAGTFTGVAELLAQAGLTAVPAARVAVFVGNAWDPQAGRETPWLDITRQLAGERGVQELGAAALSTPPGTEALARVFAAAAAPVLILFDEVLNFLNRHRRLAEPFHAFMQNLTVAMTGTRHGAAVISLPRSQIEMTDWDMQWQDRLTKVIRRVAKDLIVLDEAEIAEVVRRRLFEDIGSDKIRKCVAKTYADWCFERRAQLPPEWTAVDTSATEAKARDYLRQRFETCYPFHPATLSVFQRKWAILPQYQQTRGTLAMLAQWIAWAYRTSFTEARREPLLTLGSAPLEVPAFRSVVLGQLGESRLAAAIDADIAGTHSHARALDADTRGALRHIHRRVGTVILFESSGGQVDKVAHLPELRFALGEPDVDTTTVDNAAFALEDKAYFIRRIRSDGFRISHQPTLKKVVNDRRASLDEESEIKPALRERVKKAFEQGAAVPLIPFPDDSAAIQDTPRLTLVLLDPDTEWTGHNVLRQQLADWTRQRGKSPRFYPGTLVWCLKKPGKELREKIELWLAWRKIAREVAEGTLGADFANTERADIQAKVTKAEEAAKDAVWGGYRFVVIADSQEPDGLKAIDLGAGHSSSGETLCGRVINALKSQAILNESVGAGYIERNWPPALKAAGAWPLAGLRQSFLNGTLTRLLDPDTVLRRRIIESVGQGDFGLTSGERMDGSYDRLWFKEAIAPEEVVFEAGVFLLTKAKAQALKAADSAKPEPGPASPPEKPTRPEPGSGHPPEPGPQPEPGATTRTFQLQGQVPPELWNRFGTRLLPKLRLAGTEVCIKINVSVSVPGGIAQGLEDDLRQILEDLGLNGSLRIKDVP